MSQCQFLHPKKWNCLEFLFWIFSLRACYYWKNNSLKAHHLVKKFVGNKKGSWGIIWYFQIVRQSTKHKKLYFFKWQKNDQKGYIPYCGFKAAFSLWQDKTKTHVLCEHDFGRHCEIYSKQYLLNSST